MATFKVGDRVKLVNNYYYPGNKVGFIGHVVQVGRDAHRKCPIYRVAATQGDNSTGSNWGSESDLLACPEVVYEDEWHLNTGQDIPEDADKAWNSDKTSVVAFRCVKKPKVEYRTLYGQPKAGAWASGANCSHTHLITLTIIDGDITNVTWEKI